MKIICGFQYELYTTDEQRSALSRNAGCRRFVFNKALELQNERKKNGLSLLRYKELCLELVKWKKEEKTVFLKEAMSQPLQQALKDLDRAIADSFRPKSDPARKEWPKFKSKDIGDGFRIPQFKPEHIDDANGRVKLPKIGGMRYRKSRPLAFKCADGSMKSGTVRQIHIKKDCGHWFVVFTTEFDIEMPDPKGGGYERRSVLRSQYGQNQRARKRDCSLSAKIGLEQILEAEACKGRTGRSVR